MINAIILPILSSPNGNKEKAQMVLDAIENNGLLPPKASFYRKHPAFDEGVTVSVEEREWEREDGTGSDFRKPLESR